MVREKSHRVQNHLKHTTTAFEVAQGYRLTYTGLTHPCAVELHQRQAEDHPDVLNIQLTPCGAIGTSTNVLSSRLGSQRSNSTLICGKRFPSFCSPMGRSTSVPQYPQFMQTRALSEILVPHSGQAIMPMAVPPCVLPHRRRN